MTRHRSIPVFLFLAAIAQAFGAASSPVFADDVPESLRIEQKALKDYSQNPVVPIDRANAHRRDAESAAESATSPDKIPDTSLPDATEPSALQPGSDGGSVR